MARMGFERELEVGRAIAAQAGDVALGYRRRGLQAETKLDLSPVTAADRECERLISRILEERFPEDGLIGEEGALKESTSGRRWIIDPIDGTRDYLRGIPTWAVLIALEAGGEPVVGICNLAEQGEMCFAARASGAYSNDRRIRVSSISDPGQSVLCVNGFNDLLKLPFAGRLLEWMEQFWAVRSFGGCQDAMMVAAGKVEAWIEPYAQAWDLAPLKIIIEEAGGVFFNFDGGNSIYGGNCVACVPGLEAELRRFVGAEVSRQGAK
jgi:histidinol-phosphatase